MLKDTPPFRLNIQVIAHVKGLSYTWYTASQDEGVTWLEELQKSINLTIFSRQD